MSELLPTTIQSSTQHSVPEIPSAADSPTAQTVSNSILETGYITTSNIPTNSEATLLAMGSLGNSINGVPVTGQIKLPWIVIATPIGGNLLPFRD